MLQTEDCVKYDDDLASCKIWVVSSIIGYRYGGKIHQKGMFMPPDEALPGLEPGFCELKNPREPRKAIRIPSDNHYTIAPMTSLAIICIMVWPSPVCFRPVTFPCMLARERRLPVLVCGRGFAGLDF